MKRHHFDSQGTRSKESVSQNKRRDEGERERPKKGKRGESTNLPGRTQKKTVARITREKKKRRSDGRRHGAKAAFFKQRDRKQSAARRSP